MNSVITQRYGFKLMLDQTLLGDITDNEELETYLQNYDDAWYIGRDTDSEWAGSVIDNKGNLFSLGHNVGQVRINTKIQFLLFHV